MYLVDHEILRLQIVITNLEKELALAEGFDGQDIYKIKHLSKMALEIIEQVYERTTSTKIHAEEIIKKSPKLAFSSFIDRLDFELKKFQLQKEEKVGEWR